MGLWDGEGIQSSGSWRWDCSWLCCFWVCEAWHSPWWFVHHFWGVGMLNFVPLCLQLPLKMNVHTFFFFSSLSFLLDLCWFFLSLYGKDILDSLSESMKPILQSSECLLCSQSPYQLCFCAILVVISFQSLSFWETDKIYLFVQSLLFSWQTFWLMLSHLFFLFDVFVGPFRLHHMSARH